MHIRSRFSILLACILFPAAVMSAEPPGEIPRPQNVILFLVDDWGWTDAGILGSDLYKTPYIDNLARQGLRFNQAYAACTVCSPTRSAILTGLYPARTRVTDWIAGHSTRYGNTPLLEPDWTQRLDFDRVTIAEVLKEHGYRTASIGKWHLTPKGDPGSEAVSAYYPERHGFDVNIGGNQFGSPGSYFYPYGTGKQKRLNMPLSVEGDYITDRLTDEAVDLIHKWQEDPFFIYMPFYAVHTPIQGKPELVEKYKKQVRPGMRHTDPGYAAMLETMDTSIGRVLQTLHDLGLDQDTLIILTGDNGGLVTRGITNNAPLRDGKGSVYEGGVRVPCIVRMPGGATGINSTPVISNDVFPTILGCLGIDTGPCRTDGVDLSTLLTGEHDSLPPRDLFWHYPHYHTEGATPYSAIRSGSYRLIQYHLDGNIELYNLKNDIGESQELSRELPYKVIELKRKLDAWRQSVDAQMPVPNPQYRDDRPTMTPWEMRQRSRDSVKPGN